MEDDLKSLIFNRMINKFEQDEIRDLAKKETLLLFKEDEANFDKINESIQSYLYLDKNETYLYKLAFYLDNFKKEVVGLIKTQETNPYNLQINSHSNKANNKSNGYKNNDFDYLTQATLFTEIIPNVTLNHPSKDYIESFIIDILTEQTLFNCELDTRYQSAVSQISENFQVYMDELANLRPVLSEQFQLDMFIDNKDNHHSKPRKQKMKV